MSPPLSHPPPIPFSPYLEVVKADVVDDVPGADEEAAPVLLQQLEVVLGRLVAHEPGYFI